MEVGGCPVCPPRGFPLGLLAVGVNDPGGLKLDAQSVSVVMFSIFHQRPVIPLLRST